MDVFSEHRALLEGLAYRLCGSLADAQDIVQETHIRWSREDPSRIHDPRSWMVTVCSRLAMDLLKSAQRRRELYVGTWLPEPLLDEGRKNPAEQTALDESVSMALLFALEKLSPAQRAAFLLHEVFGYDFEAIAGILQRSVPTCRKLASRARTALHEDRSHFSVSVKEHQRLLEAFHAAARDGEVEALRGLLAEGVELHADSGGLVATAPQGLMGRNAVADFFLQIWQGNEQRITPKMGWFNGGPGLLFFQNDRLAAALCVVVRAGTIQQIFALRNPEKLRVFASSCMNGLGENRIDGGERVTHR